MKARAADALFTATRFDTPHPIVELREVGSDLVWRVKAETLTIESRPVPAAGEPELIRDRLRCRCTRCKAHASRKGGKNINHKFVCAGCVRGELQQHSQGFESR